MHLFNQRYVARFTGAVSCTIALGLIFGATPKAAYGSGSIIPDLVSITPFAGGFTYEYEAYLTPGFKVSATNFFTIYDFNGIIETPIVGPGAPAHQTGDTSGTIGTGTWSFLSLPFGPTAASESPTDSFTFNASWSWSGLDIENGTTQGGSNLFLGDFYVNSTIGATHIGQFTSQDTNNQFGLVGTPNSDIGSVLTPGAVPVSGAQTALIGMFCCGLLCLRNRKSPAKE